jgi:hypothetical protein
LTDDGGNTLCEFLMRKAINEAEAEYTFGFGNCGDGLQVFESVENFSAAGDDLISHRRQDRRFLSAVEKFCPEGLLKALDLTADGRLRQRKPLRDLLHGPFLCEENERSQFLEHVWPA